MTIYGEYLFAENFITGALLLLLTAWAFGTGISKLRIVCAATLCGAAGFLIFLPLSGLAAVLLRLAICLAVCTLGLGAKNLRSLLRQAGLFLAMTFLSGGGAMALLLWQQVPAVSGSGALYMPPLTYMKLLCFGLLAFGFSYWTVRFVRSARLRKALYGTLHVKMAEESLSFSAMIDSGNYLKEPISGKPVVLIGKRAAERMSVMKEKADERYVVIPFSGPGTKNGILEGIRSDNVSFEGKEVKGAVLAFYEGNFADSDVLLGRDFLDRGLSDERIT